MKAVQFLSKDLPLEVKEVPTPVPAQGEVLIKLCYAAFNHLDLWIWQEKVLVASPGPKSGKTKFSRAALIQRGCCTTS